MIGAFSSQNKMGLVVSPALVNIFIHDLEVVLKTLTMKSTCTRQTIGDVNYEDRALRTELPLQTRHAGTRPVLRRTSADRAYWLVPSDNESGRTPVTTDPGSWCAAVLGWMQIGAQPRDPVGWSSIRIQ